MTIANIRTKLGLALAGIGVKVYDTWPSAIQVPCAVITLDTVNYDHVLPRTQSICKWKVTLLTGVQGSLEESQNRIDEFIEIIGGKSVKYNVENYIVAFANGYLPDCDFAMFHDWTDIGYHQINNTYYYGAVGHIETT
jgi:hypothetical protein